MHEHLSARASEIIGNIQYLTIASISSSGEPWNTPVFTAFDDQLNFYWFSDHQAQHSRNVRETGKAFLVIYDSTVPEGTGEGVYIQAAVKELTQEAEVLSALRILDARAGKKKPRDFNNYSGGAILRGYQARPLKIWMNSDETNADGEYIRDIRVELDLKSLIRNR